MTFVLYKADLGLILLILALLTAFCWLRVWHRPSEYWPAWMNAGCVGVVLIMCVLPAYVGAQQ